MKSIWNEWLKKIRFISIAKSAGRNFLLFCASQSRIFNQHTKEQQKERKKETKSETKSSHKWFYFSEASHFSISIFRERIQGMLMYV